MNAGYWWGNLTGKRPLVRPRCRWDDNIKLDLRKSVERAWTGLV